MIIVVPKETAKFESRVAITPDISKKLCDLGYGVRIESNAGLAAGFSDAAYTAAGCEIVNEDIYKGANLVCRIAPPTDAEIKSMDKNQMILGVMKPLNAKANFETFNKYNITSFAIDMLPRITRGQAMDVLSSQSNLAGYKAVVDAASEYERGFPLMMTAAGTVPAARVLVMGAGVAGLQAIATAKRLGAIVSAYDVRAASKEQVESLGAKFIQVDYEETGDGAGGYAKEMTDGYKAAEQKTLSATIQKQDVVITTAQIPGKPAPTLVTEDMVKLMRAGSIVVDLAIETGGNCPLSKIGKVTEVHGVKIMAHGNVPSRIASDASQLYAKNLLNFIKTLFEIKDNAIAFDHDDELIQGTLLTQNGATVHERFAPKPAEDKELVEDKAPTTNDQPKGDA